MGKDFFFFGQTGSAAESGQGCGKERSVRSSVPVVMGLLRRRGLGLGQRQAPTSERSAAGRGPEGKGGEAGTTWSRGPWPLEPAPSPQRAATPCTVGSCWSRKENSPAAQVGGRTILTFCTQQKESGSRLWALLFSKFLLLVPGWNRAQFSLVQKAPRRAASASRSSHHLFSSPAAPARARLVEKDRHLSQVQPQFLCGKDSEV